MKTSWLRYIVLASIGFVLLIADANAQTIALHGRVAGSSTLPIRLQLLRSGVVVAEQLSDVMGRFSFADLEPGPYLLVVGTGASDHIEVVTIGSGPRELVIDLNGTRKLAAPPPAPMVRQYVPRDAERAVSRARKEYDRDNCVEALRHLQRALQLAPAFVDAHNEMGRCYLKLNDLPAAEQSFLKATEGATTVYPAINLADLYGQTGRVEEARTLLTGAALKYPNGGDAHYAHAALEFRLGRLDEAERLAEIASKAPHQLADVHLLLAKIANERGDENRVAAELETYVKEAPDSPTRREIRKLLKRIRQ